jgi:hypothetical protein
LLRGVRDDVERPASLRSLTLRRPRCGCLEGRGHQPFNFAIQAMLTFKFLSLRRRSIVRADHPGIAEEIEPDGGSSKIT